NDAKEFHSGNCRSTRGHQPVGRLRRALRHRHHLVDAVALYVLPESLLRSVGAKLLSIRRRLCHGHAVRVLSDSPWGAKDRHARRWALSSALPAERRPSSHASDCSLLQGPWRLCDFHSFFGHLHGATRARILPGRTLRHPAMAIPSRHSTRLNRRLRGALVPAQRAIAGPTYRIAWIVHRVYRLVLLGALRCSC